MTRGQSHVVGVAVLLAVTVVSLAALTAGIGTLVQDHAATADADRVATEFDTALEPVATTGRASATIRFTDGRVETVEREIRILDRSGVRARIDAGGLFFEAGSRRVAYVGDAVVRQSSGSAWLESGPPLTVDDEIIVASVARLNASDVTVTGRESASVTLRTRVTHNRTALGNGTYAIAIETATPAPLARWFRERGATVTRRDFDGDGVDSVVARFPGERVGYLVVHDMRLEVR